MAPCVLRVAQLNAGSLLEPEWPQRRLELAAWLRRLAPDVVCFEEIWQDDRTPNTAGWIVDHVSELGYHWSFGGAPFSAELWPDQSLLFGSAVLSRWPIDESNYHRLPVASLEELPTGEQMVVGGVPWELLHVRTAGLDVFACHLAPAPTHGLHRQLQVLAIDDIVREARGDLDTLGAPGERREAMPPILCGDFNAEPESDEIRFLCAHTALAGRVTGYQDAWRAAGDGPGYTQDWRANAIADSMNVNRKRIDYVFVGDPFLRTGSAGRVLSASLAFHEPLTGILASDHYGLVVDIVWPQRPD
jgi:endonuclease/exonuclease/phosphatase family metal-dependent hydrolase